MTCTIKSSSRPRSSNSNKTNTKTTTKSQVITPLDLAVTPMAMKITALPVAEAQVEQMIMVLPNSKTNTKITDMIGKTEIDTVATITMGVPMDKVMDKVTRKIMTRGKPITGTTKSRKLHSITQITRGSHLIIKVVTTTSITMMGDLTTRTTHMAIKVKMRGEIVKYLTAVRIMNIMARIARIDLETKRHIRCDLEVKTGCQRGLRETLISSSL